MVRLVPVDHDPFAAPQPGSQPAPVGPQFVPVDHDPFSPPITTDAPRVAREAGTEPDQLRATRDALVQDAYNAAPWYSKLGQAADDTARFVANGATLGFGDRISAGLSSLTGQGDYNQLLASEQERTADARARAGLAAIPAEIVGTMAIPGAALASSGIKGSAAVGAGIGAGFGASAAGDLSNIPDVAGRALTGGALGGAAGAVGAGAVKALGAVGSGLQGVANVVRGVRDPSTEAARRVAAAVGADAGKGLDAAGLAAAQAQGAPAVVADMGGETVKALARSAANTSPAARDALQGVAMSRNAAQGPRIAEFIDNLTGASGDIEGTRAALRAAAAAANKPAYARAYAEGAGGVWTPGLAQLMQAPEIMAAVRGAEKTGANKAAMSGFKATRNPFVTAPDGAMALAQDATGKTAIPTLQFWDAVKQNLDDAISRYQRGGDRGAAADAIGLKSQLLSELDAAAPSYAAARRGAAQAFGAEDALDAGRAFVTANMQNVEARRALAKMSEPERKLFEDGFATQLVEKIGALGDRRDVVNSIFGSPRARERVEIALGKQKATELQAVIRIEDIMTATGRAVNGNSTTARQLTEMGIAGGVGAVGGGFATGDWSPGSVGLGAIFGAVARSGYRSTMSRVDARVAERVGEMLASPDPAVFQRGMKIVTRSPAMMDFLRVVQSTLPKAEGLAAGNATPSAPSLLSGPIGSHADGGQEVKHGAQ